MSLCHSFKNSMMSEFDISDLGRRMYFLRVEILQDLKGSFVCQRKYAQDVLSRFGMKDCKVVKNPIVQGTKLSKEDAGTKVDATLFKKSGR